VFDLEKLIPKLPAAAIHYWDCFLGICFVLAGLFQGVTSSSAISLVLSGFGLITFSMARQCFHYIGAVRLHVCSAQHKRSLAYPKVLASIFWLAASWVCFRYAALNFHITAQWVRWTLHY
jgi:hypothetical protein